MDELLSQFLVEARELTAQAADDFAALLGDPNDRARIDSAFRAIHTLKGSVAIFDMAPAGRALHAAEGRLDQARSGTRALAAADITALVAVVDQSERWVDSLEQHGALPERSVGEADALVARLGDAPAAETPEPAEQSVSSWLVDLLARKAETVDAAAGDLVAFRYSPDADCFFRGDDPLATVAGIPELVALEILPDPPWPPLEEFEPFQCAVILEGLSAGSMADLRAAMRLVADQTEFAAVPRRAEKAGPLAAAKSFRVEASRVDALADGVGELIVASNALSHVVSQAERIDRGLAAQLRDAQTALERAVGDIRRSVMAVRMVPLGPSLRRLPRMVREIASSVGKVVEFQISGESTEVDKSIADELFEPLLHLVRNAIDHGIESAEARRAAGKPDAGALRLDVRRDGDQVVVALVDDGTGIDPGRIRAAAVQRGLLESEAADALDDAQAMRLIFAPGFSTAEAVNAVSGRGVGMDAVQVAVERLGGKVEIGSTRGKGTTIQLRLPLNAIMTRLLIVRAGGERYGIPLDRIIETASVPTHRILDVGVGRACVLRDRTLPVVSLASLLGGEGCDDILTKLLVTEADGEPVGVIVDGFGKRVDGLVRSKTGLMAGMAGIAGTMMLGDGGVLLVLDLAALIG